MPELTPVGGVKPGTVVTIGGVQYNAPELTLRGLREISPLLKHFATAEQNGVRVWVDPEGLRELLMRTLVMSLRRNYGDKADDNWLLDEMLATEYDPALDAMTAIFTASGIIRKEPITGEAESRSG